MLLFYEGTSPEAGWISRARCIREIMGIPLSFISRISNTTVLEKAGAQPASELLCSQQLSLLGKILRLPETALLRVVCFIPGTLWPAVDKYVRRPGRPRAEWVKRTLFEARARSKGADLSSLAAEPIRWKQAMKI